MYGTDDLLVRLMADGSQYQRTLGEASRSLDNFAAHATSVGRSISAPFYIAAAGITAVAAASTSAVVSSIKLAASYEQVTASFTLMVGGAEKAKKLLGEIDEFAISSPFKSADLTGSAKKLKAFGVDNDSVMPMLKSIGEITSGTGGGQEVFDRITVALGQVKTAGRLTGSELLQFTNANVPMIEYLAQTLKKPQSAIKMMVEEGKIGYPQVLAAFNAMTHGAGVFAGQMDAASKTVKGRWDALDETWQVMQRNFGEGMMKGFRVAELLEDAKNWIDTFKTGGMTTEEFFAKARKGFDELVGYVNVIASFIKYNQEWVIVLLKVGGALLAVHFGMVLLNGALLLATPLLTAFKLGWAGVTLAVAAYNLMIATASLTTLAFPLAVGALTLAIGLLALELLDITNISGNLGETFGNTFDELSKSFGEAWSGLKDAVAIGDWDAVGKIIGKTLEVAWQGTIATMKTLWLDFTNWLRTNLADIGYWIDLQMVEGEEKLALIANKPMNAFGGGDERDAKTRADYARKRNDVVTARNTAQAGILQGYEASKAQIEAPFKQAQAELAGMVDGVRALKNELDPSFRASRQSDNYQRLFDPAEADAGRDALTERLKLAGVAGRIMDDFGGAIEVSWKQAVMPSLRRTMAETGKFEGERTRTALRFAASVAASFTGAGGIGTSVAPGTIKQNPDIPLPLQTANHGEALKLAQGIQKELLTGGKGNLGGTPFDQFKKNMGLLQEARDGPMGDSLGGMFKGAGALLNDKEYKYGQNEEYEKLRKFVGPQQMVAPPTMYRGDVNTQDKINDAFMNKDKKDPQQEILETLRAAEMLQEAQRDYAQRTAEALEELTRNGLLKAGDMNR